MCATAHGSKVVGIGVCLVCARARWFRDVGTGDSVVIEG